MALWGVGNRWALIRSLFMANHKGEIAAAHLGLAVDDDVWAQLFDDTIHQVSADLLVSHFAATEDDHDLDAITILEKLESFADFNIEVILPNFQTESNLFELATLGVLFGASLFFHLLVLVFAPIDDFDYWWIGVRGNFH